MYEAFYFELPLNMQSMFNIDSNIYYGSRSKFNFKQKYVRTKLKSMCVKLWKTDDKVKSSQNLSLF